jgi:hypothetical protein
LNTSLAFSGDLGRDNPSSEIFGVRFTREGKERFDTAYVEQSQNNNNNNNNNDKKKEKEEFNARKRHNQYSKCAMKSTFTMNGSQSVVYNHRLQVQYNILAHTKLF